MCVCVTRSSNSMLEWLAADWKKACAPISFPLPFPLFSTDKRAQCREKAEKAASASYLSLGAKGLSACRHITLRPPHTPARLNLPSNPPFPSFSSSNSRPVVVPLAGVCLSRFPSSFSPPLLYNVSLYFLAILRAFFHERWGRGTPRFPEHSWNLHFDPEYLARWRPRCNLFRSVLRVYDLFLSCSCYNRSTLWNIYAPVSPCCWENKLAASWTRGWNIAVSDGYKDGSMSGFFLSSVT